MSRRFYLRTVSSKRQLAIPVALRHKLGWKPGDRVSVATDGKRIMLSLFRQEIEALAGSMARKEDGTA